MPKEEDIIIERKNNYELSPRENEQLENTQYDPFTRRDLTALEN